MWYTYTLKKGTNDVFYVGIGSKRRAYTTNKRNCRWYQIYEQFDFDVSIINEVSTYEDAIAIETELIKCFGRIGYEDGGTLANIALTPSSTFYGRKHSNKTKKLMSEKAKDRGKAVVWYGRKYKSLRECSRKELVPFSTVQKYISWDKKPQCYKQ